METTSVRPSVRTCYHLKRLLDFYKNLVPTMCTWRHWATVTFVKSVQGKTCFSAGRKYNVGGTFYIFPPLFIKFRTQKSHKLLHVFSNRKFCWNRSRRFCTFITCEHEITFTVTPCHIFKGNKALFSLCIAPRVHNLFVAAHAWLLNNRLVHAWLLNNRLVHV